MANFLVNFKEAKKIGIQSYNSLISMDQALSYPRFVLCIKPHEKRLIRGEKNNFSISIDNDLFWENRNGVSNAKFSKMSDVLVELRKAEKIKNTSRIIA